MKKFSEKSAFIGLKEYQATGLHEVISVKAILGDRNQYCLDQLVFGKIKVCTTDCIRAPPRRGRYWKIHPRHPRDFPREISRAEGMVFPIPPESWWSTDILSSSNFLQGVDQQILPCGQGRIDSVKINPSLLMMRELSLPQISRVDFVSPHHSDQMSQRPKVSKKICILKTCVTNSYNVRMVYSCPKTCAARAKV